MKKLHVLAAFAALTLCVGAAMAEDQAADGKRFNPTTGIAHTPVPVLVGGMYATDTTSRVLRTNTSGYLQTTQMNRQSDDNTIKLVQAFPPQLQGNQTWTLTSFVDISTFKAWNVHCSWTDSVGTAASSDSILFELVPVGKHSVTNDGLDYVINLAGTNGATDTTFCAWAIGSPRNPAATVAAGAIWSVKQDVLVPNAIARPGAPPLFLQEVSFPLALKNGAPINENYIGFLVRPAGATTAAINNIHNLTIWLVAKAN